MRPACDLGAGGWVPHTAQQALTSPWGDVIRQWHSAV